MKLFVNEGNLVEKKGATEQIYQSFFAVSFAVHHKVTRQPLFALNLIFLCQTEISYKSFVLVFW